MNEHKQKQLMNVAIVFLVVLGLSVLSWGYYNYQRAQSVAAQAENTISFTAEGKVLAKPDIAKVIFYVVTQGEKADEVQAENNETMEAAIAFVKEQGVGEEDIQTVQYNLSPEYDYDWCRTGSSDSRSCSPKIIGYRLDQGVQAKIRDFDQINVIMGGLAEKGVNRISNVDFTIDDPEGYKNEARILALTKAEERARLMAEKTAIKLGKIVDISEGVSVYSAYAQGMKSSAGYDMEMMEDAAVPMAALESGSEEVIVTLTVTYKLK